MIFTKSKLWLLAAPVVLGGGIALAGAGGRHVMYSEGSDPTIGDTTKMTPQESLARSKQMSTQMTTTEARVATLAKRAETKKDMVMMNCVSDKLVQLRGYMAVGNNAAGAVEQAVQRGNDGERAHNLDRQIIVYQKVLVLGTEAEGCIGEDVSYVGKTRVDLEIDPSIPEEDPTIPKIPPIVDYRPPEGECPAA
jgi:hypothetical protein